MSKIEAGHRKLNRGTVDLRPLLDDLERMFRLRADAKRLRFEIERAPGVPRLHRGRRGQAAAGARQPARQRGEVHRARAASSCGSGRARGRRRAAAGGRGRGHRARHRRRRAGGAVPALRPGARGHRGARRHGARPGAQPRVRAAHGRRHHRREPPGRGSVVPARSPASSSARPRSPAPRAARGRVVGIARRRAPPRGSWWSTTTRTTGAGSAAPRCRSASRCARRTTARRRSPCSTRGRPHLVLIDLHMPVLDGFAAMRAIRARPGGRAWPSSPSRPARSTTRATPSSRPAPTAGCASRAGRAQLLEEIARLLGVQYRLRHAARALPLPLAAGGRRAARA